MLSKNWVLFFYAFRNYQLFSSFRCRYIPAFHLLILTFHSCSFVLSFLCLHKQQKRDRISRGELNDQRAIITHSCYDYKETLPSLYSHTIAVWTHESVMFPSLEFESRVLNIKSYPKLHSFYKNAFHFECFV